MTSPSVITLDPLASKTSGTEQKPTEPEHCMCCLCTKAKADKPQEVPEQATGTLQKISLVTEDPKTQQVEFAFRFLDLPAELRCFVYEELLVVGKVFYKGTGYPERDNTIRFRNKQYFREPYLAILRTCKLVHDESEKVYLDKNLFVLPIQWQLYAPFKASLHYLNDRYVFSKRGLSHVRNLSITWTVENS